MDFLNITEETEDKFRQIARTLFDSYAIQTHNAIYRIIEMEFYWNSITHEDNSTYKRNHVNPKSGDWFFHYSGVDIALKNEKTGGYGGILIRGIYDIENKKQIKGPMICSMKMFSETNAFSQSIKTQIVPYEFKRSKIINKSRIGLGENAKKSGTDKLNYAFLIDPLVKDEQ
jgi:hypothetical protein